MIRHYSHLFSCLYDQPAPIGRGSGGAHHSVFRSTQWRAIEGYQIPEARTHDFAVIWDERHDEQIISIVEQLHIRSLLWPIVFIGERDEILTVLLDSAGGPNAIGQKSDWRQKFIEFQEDHAENRWSGGVGIYQRLTEDEDGSQTDPRQIIPQIKQRVVPYLQAVDVLWLLGDRESVFWRKAD